MAYEKLPEFLYALRESTADSSTKLGLEYLILTVARSREVRHMEWREVDMERATWIVPASHMKARREHRVPLSARALRVLEEARSLGTGEGLVFPSRKGRPLSNMAFNMVLRRLEVEDAVPHGFRSTFKDWTLEETSYPWAVVETALAHTLGTATEAAYARSDLFDRRRELMEAWAKHCERGSKAPAVEVLPDRACVKCQGPVPEKRGGLDTCSPDCHANTGLSRWLAFERAGRRHSLECQEQGASPNTMRFLPGPYFRCKGCDCWCHIGVPDASTGPEERRALAKATGTDSTRREVKGLPPSPVIERSLLSRILGS